VENRASLISKNWHDDLYKYFTGIVKNSGHKMLACNGMPDHVHLFINMQPNQSISKLVQQIKGSSSKWINEQNFIVGKFNWQSGFGAFSYAKSQIDSVVKYIINQENHHKKKTFKNEYLEMLKAFDVKYNEQFIFKEIK
jgi:REP element-mobilizing transposase RayT